VSAETTSPDESRGGGTLQAVLLLLPVLALAWVGPGWILERDLLPQATGIGFVALALLPAALSMVTRRTLPPIRGLWLLLVPILVAVAWLATDELTDTFEASRVLLQWIVALVCVLAGASLGARGRTLLVRGAVVVTLALAGYGLFDAGRAYTGALGNTGSLSEAALAGAVAGAALAATGRGAWRFAGLLSLVVFLLYTARVPVLAGSLSAAVGLGALMLARSGSARAIAGAMTAMSLIALVIPLSRPSGAPGTPSASTNEARVASNAGGVRVRLLIWKSSLSMSASHPLAGVGTGQFAAAFPAWRDPAEIERTTHGRRVAQETEVEHPHNDWLAPWLEGGWLAGLAWTAFLTTVGWGAWKRLKRAREDETAELARSTAASTEIALAAASIALLVNALVRGPLLQNPVSSVLAFSMFGTLLAGESTPARRTARRFVAIGAVALLVVVVPRAAAFVRHGCALQRLTIPDAEPKDVQRAVADAIAACPDSVPARSWSARIAESRRDGKPLVLEEWGRVLDLRPRRIEAWIQVGNHFGASQPDRARAAYARVLALDAKHPGALQNMGTLELNTGHPAKGLAWFEKLPAHRAPTSAWLEELGARLALRGVDDSAEAVFARADPKLAALTPEQCFGLAKELRKTDRPPFLADAWEARAHLGWAREHAAAGRFNEAVRSYRQAVRLCTTHVEDPRRPRLELAAALVLAGKTDEARTQVEGLVPTPEDLAAMPKWAAEPLRTVLATEQH
jgi:O-antigen ligase